MKLKLEVSLDDAWASGWAEGMESFAPNTHARVMLRAVAGNCTITTSGAVVDPGGNTIGYIEVTA